MRSLPDDFQLEQLRAAMCMVNRFESAVDIGAHRGIWTGEMLKYFKSVIAIEPTDLVLQIPSQATAIKAACGAKKGYCSMESGPRNDGQTHVIEGRDIKMITLDSLKLKPDFIKIDVEGMEFDVLQGGKDTILENKPFVMIEENCLSERYGHYTGRAMKLLTKWGMKPLLTFHMLPEKDINILLGW